MRHKVVSICAQPRRAELRARPDWSTGWLMFENADRDEPPRVTPANRCCRCTRGRKRQDYGKPARFHAQSHLRSAPRTARSSSVIVAGRAAAPRPRRQLHGQPAGATRTTRGEPYRCAD